MILTMLQTEEEDDPHHEVDQQYSRGDYTIVQVCETILAPSVLRKFPNSSVDQLQSYEVGAR